MNILIVKTSSFGDIIQTFGLLEYLHNKFKNVSIDWVVKEKCSHLVSSHPLVRNVISFKSIFNISFLKKLRSFDYDIVFDLQSNTKSGIITFFSKSKNKVGFDLKSSSEWPNILFTNKKIRIDNSKNIRIQYLNFIKEYFKDSESFNSEGINLKNINLKMTNDEKERLLKQLSKIKSLDKINILVSPHSRWENKKLNDSVLIEFLKMISKKYNVFFLFLYGDEKEKKISEKISSNFYKNSILLDKLTLPMLQHLIDEIDLVISYDSSPLHLCYKTPSFSIFGPSNKEIYKPIGDAHLSIQGKCPYGEVFVKRCSFLRTCKNPGCMWNFKSDELFSKCSFLLEKL